MIGTPAWVADVVRSLAEESGTVSELADRLGLPIEQVAEAVNYAHTSGFLQARREGKPELVATLAGRLRFVGGEPEPAQGVTLSPESVEAVAQRVMELLAERDALQSQIGLS